MNRSPTIRRLAIALSTAALLISGCGGNDDSRPPKAPPVQMSPPAGASAAQAQSASALMPAPNMASFRANLVQAQKDVDNTLASLRALTDPQQQNLRSAYNDYCSELFVMQQHAQRMKREADAMRASSDSYFNNWDKNTSDIDNPTIRASAEARQKRLRDDHEQIMTTSADARDSYRPFIKDLQDIKSYLSTDLSKARVADINDAATKLHSDGMDVKAKIDRVIKVLDSIDTPGTT